MTIRFLSYCKHGLEQSCWPCVTSLGSYLPIQFPGWFPNQSSLWFILSLLFWFLLWFFVQSPLDSPFWVPDWSLVWFASRFHYWSPRLLPLAVFALVPSLALFCSLLGSLLAPCLGPLLSRTFRSRFYRFVIFLSRYGRSLSQLVNFNSTGKFAKCSLSPTGIWETNQESLEEKKCERKDWEKSGSLEQNFLRLERLLLPCLVPFWFIIWLSLVPFSDSLFGPLFSFLIDWFPL